MLHDMKRVLAGAVIGVLATLSCGASAATTAGDSSAVCSGLSETQQNAAAEDAYTHWQVDRHAPYGNLEGGYAPWSELSGQRQADWRNIASAAVRTACATS